MSMSILVAIGAKSNEILSRIIAQVAPPLDVMDLKLLYSPAQLTTPSISLQNVTA
jgi:hypothetical protein